jgi:hypothetical protein
VSRKNPSFTTGPGGAATPALFQPIPAILQAPPPLSTTPIGGGGGAAAGRPKTGIPASPRKTARVLEQVKDKDIRITLTAPPEGIIPMLKSIKIQPHLGELAYQVSCKAIELLFYLPLERKIFNTPIQATILTILYEIQHGRIYATDHFEKACCYKNAIETAIDILGDLPNDGHTLTVRKYLEAQHVILKSTLINAAKGNDDKEAMCEKFGISLTDPKTTLTPRKRNALQELNPRLDHLPSRLLGLSVDPRSPWEEFEGQWRSRPPSDKEQVAQGHVHRGSQRKKAKTIEQITPEKALEDAARRAERDRPATDERYELYGSLFDASEEELEDQMGHKQEQNSPAPGIKE